MSGFVNYAGGQFRLAADSIALNVFCFIHPLIGFSNQVLPFDIVIIRPSLGHTKTKGECAITSFEVFDDLFTNCLGRVKITIR